MKNVKYLDWVKTLPCQVCETDQLIDAHHIIGKGDGITGGRQTDYWSMPLCRRHHDELHMDMETFELVYGSQWEMVARTTKRAIFEGVLLWQSRW